MKDLIGICAVCLIGLGWYAQTIPTVEERQRAKAHLCPTSNPVTVNGEIVGCTDDKQTASNMYIPKHGVLPMRKIREYNDDWIVGGK